MIIGNVMKTIFFLVIFVILISSADMTFAASTEDLVQRVGQAANNVARGDVNGAVNSAISGQGFNIGNQGRVNVGVTGASLYQQVPPIGSYNANAYLNPGGRPAANQNFNVNTGTRYVRNTTSFSLDR